MPPAEIPSHLWEKVDRGHCINSPLLVMVPGLENHVRRRHWTHPYDRKGWGALSEQTSQPRHGAPGVTVTAVDTQCRVCPGIPREEGHPPSYPGCPASAGAERGLHLEQGAAWCPGVQIRTGFDVILDYLGKVTGRIPPPPKKHLVSNPQNLRRATLRGGTTLQIGLVVQTLRRWGEYLIIHRRSA